MLLIENAVKCFPFQRNPIQTRYQMKNKINCSAKNYFFHTHTHYMYGVYQWILFIDIMVNASEQEEEKRLVFTKMRSIAQALRKKKL